MNFLYPHALWLLLLIPLIGLGISQHQIALRHEHFEKINSPSPWQLTATVPYWPLISLALLVICIAHPQKLIRDEHRGKEGIAIQVLLDVSTSMDISTTMASRRNTRMEVAKQVIKEFVAGDGNLMMGRPDDLIGVITFSRYADTLCPLTQSHDAIVSMIDDVQVNERPNEDGTAYGDATALAAALLQKLDEKQGDHQNSEAIKSKVIVLLTDGENNCGRFLPIQAAAMAKAWGIKVYAISLGDPPSLQQQNTKSGSIVTKNGYSEAEWGLKEMADNTGGFFSRAHSYESLKEAYQRIDTLETSRLSLKSIERFESQASPWAVAALCFACFGPFLQLCGWRSSC